MALVQVQGPYCNSIDVVKYGSLPTGEQRYLCNNLNCKKKTFLLNYKYNGRLPEVKNKIIDMALKGSGIRDTARVLKISSTTIIEVLKKKESELHNVNMNILKNIAASNKTEVIIQKAEESELDEMWSFVGSKSNQRWLWHAIDHQTGNVLAYVFGSRKDEVFLELKSLLELLGIKKFIQMIGALTAAILILTNISLAKTILGE